MLFPIRLLLVPLRLILFTYFRIRNLFKPSAALYHQIPPRFIRLHPSGILSMFLPEREAHYFDYLQLLKTLERSKSLQRLVYLVPEMNAPWNEIEEIGRRLEALRGSGKELIAFSEGGNLKTIYLMSYASRRFSAPHSYFWTAFPAAEPFFLKGLLRRLGIEMEAFRAGRFKSAVEIYTRTSFSPEARRDLERLIADLRKQIRSRLEQTVFTNDADHSKFFALLRARSRCAAADLLDVGFIHGEIPEVRFRKFIATGETGPSQPLHDVRPESNPDTANSDPERSVSANTDLQKSPSPRRGRFARRRERAERKRRLRTWRNEIKADKQTEKYFASESAFYHRVRRSQFPAVRLRSLPALATVVLDGNIIMGHPGSSVRSEIISALAYRELFNTLQQGREEAVFLLINSPGGSAEASEIIYQSIAALARRKPVFAVLGSVAASGGYYIACAANRIYSAATTLTGSIGVFVMHPNLAGLYRKTGITRQRIAFDATQDLLSESKPLGAASRKLVARQVQSTYEQFLERVCEGRSRNRKEVERLAGGQVRTGAAFSSAGMADGLLDLFEAVDAYRRKAGYPEGQEFRLHTYPVIRTDFNMLIDRFRSGPFSGLLRHIAPIGKTEEIDSPDAESGRILSELSALNCRRNLAYLPAGRLFHGLL